MFSWHPQKTLSATRQYKNGEVQLTNLLCLLNAEVDGDGVLNAPAGRGYYDRIAYRINHWGYRSWSTGTASCNGHGSTKDQKE